MGLSIVTVCMNRREHLLATAPKVSAWPHHREHVIVDWSSAVPLRREELPADPRVRLLRVEGEPRWNLCRAYNFAVAQARGEWVLKLDADAWPTEAFDPDQPGLRLEGDGSGERGPLCAFGSGPEGRKGQFLIERGLFEAVGGFNELLVGYGFDDKDLLARLQQLSGEMARFLPPEWVGVIAHSDAERAGQGASRAGLAVSQGLAAMRATRLANRILAAHCPWGPRARRSAYRQEAPGLWRLEPGSLPRPPQQVVAEAEHARRMTFWGFFLAIPEVFLEVLPFSLFPPACQGRWQVRWWHRLWWHSGRRLLELPVTALVAGRQLLAGGSRRPPEDGFPWD
ncbi:MAG: glycosyltransferase family 2 protein [Cyanobacteriota bacterium]